MKRKIFTLTFALLASLSLWATGGSCGANATWDLTGNTLTISGSGAMDDYYSGGAPWYSSHNSIRTVAIDAEITHIGQHAFYQFLDLVNVSFGGPTGSKLASVGNSAFSGCPDLTSIEIPSSVKYIGDYVFQNCTSLVTLVLYPTIPPTITNNTFNTASNINLYALDKSQYHGYGRWLSYSFKSYNNMTTIASGTCGTNLSWTLNSRGLLTISGTGAMTDYQQQPSNTPAPWYDDYHSNVNYVSIEDGVTSIGACAFKGCSVYSVSISNSVTTIGPNAFQGCTGLSSITIPRSVTLINNYAFQGCTNLEHATILSTHLNELGEGVSKVAVFGGCTNLKYLKCHAVTPPNTGTPGATNWFYNVPNTAILYVLQDCIQAYDDYYIQTRHRDDKDDPWEYTNHYIYHDAFAEIRPLTETATIGTTGWATFSADVPLDLSGMTASTGTPEAYYAYNAAGSTVNLRSTEDIVPADEGLILKGSYGAIITIPVAASGTAISGNKLVGCPTGVNVGLLTTDYNYFYVLAATNNVAVFENISNYVNSNAILYIPEGRAYLNLAGMSLAPGALGIVFEEDNATKLEALAETDKAVKFIENGQLLILRDGVTYDAMGRVVR